MSHIKAIAEIGGNQKILVIGMAKPFLLKERVYVELKHHGSYLKRILTDQHERLHQAKQKLNNVEEKQRSLDDRLLHAVQTYGILDERLKRFRSLPGPNKRPLSRAERDFKSQLDSLAGMELDAMHSAIEALNARLRRCTESTPGNALNSPRQALGRKNHVSNVQISQLKSALEKLSVVNSENSTKVKLVESALRGRFCVTYHITGSLSNSVDAASDKDVFLNRATGLAQAIVGRTDAYDRVSPSFRKSK
ncbi:hypothetical protein ACLOJK_018562 [Asimina triloba]